MVDGYSSGSVDQWIVSRSVHRDMSKSVDRWISTSGDLGPVDFWIGRLVNRWIGRLIDQ